MLFNSCISIHKLNAILHSSLPHLLNMADFFTFSSLNRSLDERIAAYHEKQEPEECGLDPRIAAFIEKVDICLLLPPPPDIPQILYHGLCMAWLWNGNVFAPTSNLVYDVL